MLSKLHPTTAVTHKSIKSIAFNISNKKVQQNFVRTVTHVSEKQDSICLKPFEQIPCPPGINLPVIGHTAHFIKKPNGFERSWKNVLELKTKFVTQGEEMIRLNIPLSNPAGDGKLLIIFDPGNKERVIHK